MMKFSATLEGPFVGTAEELAAYVSGKLASLGFGPRFQANERLVRFYAFEGLIDKPERAEDDKRRANFGDKQVRQLLVARILSERGNDLETIRGMLRQHGSRAQLNQLVDEHAMASELESRSSREIVTSMAEPSETYLRSPRRLAHNRQILPQCQ